MSTSFRFFALTFCVLLTACGGEPMTQPDAGPRPDGGPTTPDAGPAVSVCMAHADCDDGSFCNGAELCRPGDALADPRGCIPAPTPPCMASQTCNEETAHCDSDCGVDPDADDDSYLAEACGGPDCDDSDPSVHPGAAEVCDALGRNEDCNPDTLSGPDETDVDHDGYVAEMCCNIQRTGALRCGLDCDDGTAAANPAHPEVCDGIDNNCDGMVDEHAQTTFYRDADADLYGDESDTMEACTQPDGYVASPGDCDDGMSTVHPTAAETCNDADDDCDTMIDEEVTPAPETPENCGGCGLVCPAGYMCNGSVCEDRAAEVAAGNGFVAVRGESGRVYTWGTHDGWTDTIESVPGVDAAQIAASELTGCAVVGDGSVLCWGVDQITRARITGSASVAGITGAVAVSVGALHSCAITSAGALFCWGDNTAGQLGTGDTTARTSPVEVSLPGFTEDVVAGFGSTCARLSTGDIYCWGNGSQGSLGTGVFSSSTSPGIALASGTGLGGGGATACAELASEIQCWGRNYEAGSSTNTANPTSIAGYPATPTLQTRTVLARGTGLILGSGSPCTVFQGHSCAINAASRLFCWGDNGSGQLGDSTTTSRTNAAIVAGIPGDITSVGLGYDYGTRTGPGCTASVGGFSCATNDAGAVYCWGDNRGGLLRTGDTMNRLEPEAVVGFPVRVAPSSM